LYHALPIEGSGRVESDCSAYLKEARRVGLRTAIGEDMRIGKDWR